MFVIDTVYYKAVQVISLRCWPASTFSTELNILWLLLQLFLDYTAETYSKFMQGDDTFEDEDESFLTKLSKHSISLWSFNSYVILWKN